MPRTLVWDLPTRLFHWLFAGGFIAAAVIALGLGDDSPVFPYHGIIGLALGLMLVLRLAWGLVGTRHARFGSFAFGPRAAAGYFGGVLTGRPRRYAGHNPGSAYAIFAMLALMLGLAVTGVMLGRGNEGVKDVHEVLVYAMIAVAGAHVLGVILHTLRHRENLTAGMVHGRKDVSESEGIRSSRPLAAAVFLLITGAWTAALVNAYDPATRSTTAPLLGVGLQLGEADEGGNRPNGDRRHDRDED
ncbi:MAG: cytochrome b/b6 domain-containing protein [Phycisphaerales bacterium]|nr:cytochrome b/b6 domain-containing protein [Phycisphaerales bacterium]